METVSLFFLLWFIVLIFWLPKQVREYNRRKDERIAQMKQSGK